MEYMKAKKLMLLCGIVSGAILIALTAVMSLGYDTLEHKGLGIYMMAVPIFMTVLAFVLGYIDITEKLDDGEVHYMVWRSCVFGGLMFAMTLVAIVAMIII
ncbi:MAG: hypothetical protein J5707_00810 [Candidatus Methanomethylophilus sp.]|nr:hypothetical protein [Methanomethylophilus sp.]